MCVQASGETRTTCVDPSDGRGRRDGRAGRYRRGRRSRRGRPRRVPRVVVAPRPGERSARADPSWPACSSRARRGVRRRSRPAGGQADPAQHRVRRPGHGRQHRVLRRRRPQPRGQGRRRSTPADHTSMIRREADRGRRLDRPVELPAADGRLEDPAGGRGRQHDRAQAGRDHPADVAAARPGVRRRRASRTAWSTWSRAPAASPARPGRRTRTSHGLVHRLDRRRRTRDADRGGDGQADAPGARRQGAVRRASTTPTSRPPCTARSPGALINTGQDCTAATRAYVQRPLYDAFVAGVADVMATVRLGPTLDPATDQGPLVSRRQQEHVVGMVERARG